MDDELDFMGEQNASEAELQQSTKPVRRPQYSGRDRSELVTRRVSMRSGSC
jgi:hypothetical protein